MKLKNKFIVIVPVYNMRELIVPCLDSIFDQTYDDLGLIIRDDMSTDGTDKIIEEYLKDKAGDILFIKNTKKLYPVGNTYESVINNVENHDSIIGVVDGDDRLISVDAVKKIMNIYDSQDKWLVWSQHVNTNGSMGQSKHLPSDDIIYSNRNYWSVSHFRTSKAFLFDKINKNDLIDPFVRESYYTFSGDAAFLFPFIEMCGNEKSFFLDEPLYCYNNELPTNEHHKSLQNALKYGQYIREFGQKYQKFN
jgi:glycosyltransferase involved in cell wall biosynthesis